MQTKHICALVLIWTKGDVGAPLNRFKPSSKIFSLTVPRRCLFVDHLCYFCLVLLCLSCTSVCWCLVVTCWERADLLALVCDVWLWRCHFSIGTLSQVCCFIVSIPDICPLSYFDTYFDKYLISKLYTITFLWIALKDIFAKLKARNWNMMIGKLAPVNKTIFINVSHPILVTSLARLATSKWYDTLMKSVLRTGASLLHR